jgi:hypothetical protein
MTHREYENESTRLREVLKDACDRGDYYLEMDVREALMNLQEAYYKED